MNVTFDKKARGIVWRLLKDNIKDRTSPFCGTRIDGRNFAGAIHFEGKPRAIDGCITCLFGVVDLTKEDK